MGRIAYQTGQLDEAVQMMEQSVRADPTNAERLNELACVLKDQGRPELALLFLEAASAVAPNEPEILGNMGAVLRELNRSDEAADCLERAIALGPASRMLHCNRGTLHALRGELEKALACYSTALEIDPHSPEVLSNIGSVLNAQGRYPEAVESNANALKTGSRSKSTRANLTTALENQNKAPDAMNPIGLTRSWNALNDLGCALKQAGWIEDAVAYFQAAVKLKPDAALGYSNLGLALVKAGRIDEAIASLRKAVELDPANPKSQHELAQGLNRAGRARESLACFRKMLEADPNSPATFSNYLLTLNSLPGHSAAEVFAEHTRFDRLFCHPLRSLQRPHGNTPDPQRRLRVGYVSADFRDHPLAHFIEPVFANYSRKDFELFCYANQDTEDETSARLRRQVDHWRNVLPLTDAQLSDTIRQDRIDILVDLSGHTAGNRLLVFARKPAPVQVTMIGYMQTTGLSAIDYRITDDALDPAGTSEQLSSETLVRLSAGAFMAGRECPPVNELPALANGYVTFASFNSPVKINEEVIATWADVLRAVPGSRLLITCPYGDCIANALQAQGIARERLETVNWQSREKFLALHHRVDFLLDPFPYNGGTISLIAAWMGVPIITLAGHGTISRYGGRVLKIVGLPGLIANDRTEYVSKAADAVSDLQRLAQWRASMRAKLEAWAGDGSQFTGELGAAFREMWQCWCAKETGHKGSR